MNISLGIAEGPGVARGKKYIKINYEEKKILLIFVRPPGLPMSVHKNFSPLGPTVWPTIQSEHIQGVPHHIRPSTGLNCDFRD